MTNGKTQYQTNVEHQCSHWDVCKQHCYCQSWHEKFCISSVTLLLTLSKSFKLVSCFLLFVKLLVKAIISLCRWHWWMSEYKSYFIKILAVLFFWFWSENLNKMHLFGLSFILSRIPFIRRADSVKIYQV